MKRETLSHKFGWQWTFRLYVRERSIRSSSAVQEKTQPKKQKNPHPDTGFSLWWIWEPFLLAALMYFADFCFPVWRVFIVDKSSSEVFFLSCTDSHDSNFSMNFWSFLLVTSDFLTREKMKELIQFKSKPKKSFT